jgi:hypothetical protein
VGVPTGAANGFDVLDIDPDGRAWYDQNFDALPLTEAHTTPRGLHLLFQHAPGLRNSARRIAPGVDVRADGGFVIWWPREGYPIEEHPLTEWPSWLLEELTRRRSSGATNSEIVAANRVLNTCLGQRAEGRVVSLHDALAHSIRRRGVATMTAGLS